MIAETYCNTFGIDSIGKNIPESITIGMSSTIADNNKATNCVLAMLETSKPNERAKRIYIVEITNIQNTDPCKGTPSRLFAISRMTIRMMKASTK